MNPRYFLILVLPCVLAVSCAGATKNTFRDEKRGEDFRLEVVSEGYVLPVFEHRGRSYIEGRQGARYLLRITNNSPGRIEVVAAVDGRDVIDGQPMDSDKHGYIILPHSSAVIDGWRTSMQTVAAFRFTSPEDSYSTRMGSSSRKLGMIEVAVFREKREPRGPLVLQSSSRTWEREAEGIDEAAPQAAPAESGASMDDWKDRYPRRKKSNLGTQFGETHQSSVQEVDFVRESSSPDFWLGLRYDDASGLCELGLKDFCGGERGPLQPTHHAEPERHFAQPPP